MGKSYKFGADKNFVLLVFLFLIACFSMRSVTSSSIVVVVFLSALLLVVVGVCHLSYGHLQQFIAYIAFKGFGALAHGLPAVVYFIFLSYGFCRKRKVVIIASQFISKLLFG